MKNIKDIIAMLSIAIDEKISKKILENNDLWLAEALYNIGEKYNV